MKRAPQETKVIQNLAPSKFSGVGFMGNDSRDVEEVISADARTLERLGTDSLSVAGKLQIIFDLASAELGDELKLSENLTVQYLACRGRIPSPFPGEGSFEKNMVLVQSDDKSIHFYITPLSIHLIKKHGFFQGRGSPFRIEPEIIAGIASEMP